MRFPPIIACVAVWAACASHPPDAPSSPAAETPAQDASLASADASGPDAGRCPPGTHAVIHQGVCAPCLYGRKCPCGPTVVRCEPDNPPPPPPQTAVKGPHECALGDTCADGTQCQCCPAGGPRQKCLCTSACTTDQDCKSADLPRCNIWQGQRTTGMCTEKDFSCCWGCR